MFFNHPFRGINLILVAPSAPRKKCGEIERSVMVKRKFLLLCELPSYVLRCSDTCGEKAEKKRAERTKETEYCYTEDKRGWLLSASLSAEWGESYVYAFAQVFVFSSFNYVVCPIVIVFLHTSEISAAYFPFRHVSGNVPAHREKFLAGCPLNGHFQ